MRHNAKEERHQQRSYRRNCFCPSVRKGYKGIPKQSGVHHSTVRKIIHKWKTFKTVANLPRKFTPWSDCSMFRDTVKNPRATSQTLQASVSMLNVRVYDSSIRKRLNKYDSFGRVAGESLFSLKRTWQHALGLQSHI